MNFLSYLIIFNDYMYILFRCLFIRQFVLMFPQPALKALRRYLPLQVAEWTDEGGFQAIAAKYVRLRPHAEIEKNRTYIVTAIMVLYLKPSVAIKSVTSIRHI